MTGRACACKGMPVAAPARALMRMQQGRTPAIERHLNRHPTPPGQHCSTAHLHSTAAQKAARSTPQPQTTHEPGAKATGTMAVSFRDIMSEQAAAQLAGTSERAHAGPRAWQRGDAAADSDDDLAVALQLSLAEASSRQGDGSGATACNDDGSGRGSGIGGDECLAAENWRAGASASDPARQQPAGPADTVPALFDDDLALAMAMQEEEDDRARSEAAARTLLASASVRRSDAGGNTVQLVSREAKLMEQVAAASRASAMACRTLYGAGDAEAGHGVFELQADSHVSAEGALRQDMAEEELYSRLRGRAGGLVLCAVGDGHGAVVTGAAAGSSPVVISKHDVTLAGRRAARHLERELGPIAGDMSGLKLSAPAVSSLRRHIQKQSVKGQAARGRVEAATYATVGAAVDRRTQATLFKMVLAGRLEGVSGPIRAGKESHIFHGFGWDPARHEQLLAEAPGAQQAQAWVGGAGAGEDGDDGAGSEEASNGCAAGVGSTPVTGGGGFGDGGAVEDVAWGDRVDGSLADGAGAEASHPCADPAMHASPDVAVKVFGRLGEFRTRREYVEGDRRYAYVSLPHNPRKMVEVWAAKEYKNLVRVHRAGIPSPAPLLLRGHVLVLTLVGSEGLPAPQLREAGLTGTRAATAYAQVVAAMYAMYHWAHLVHADLSEYNVLYFNGRCFVIDFGQAVDTSHGRAQEFLAADAANVTAFFGRLGVHVLPPAQLARLVVDPTVAPHPLSAAAMRTGSRHGTVPLPGSGLRTTRADASTAAARGLLAGEDAGSGTGACGTTEAAEAATSADGEPECGVDVFDGKSGPIVAALRAALAAHHG